MADGAGVDDVGGGIAGLMRVGTRIAHKVCGFHRGLRHRCGNGGKRGLLKRGQEQVFQFSGIAQARFRNRVSG